MTVTFKIVPNAVVSTDAEDKAAILERLAALFAHAYGLGADEVLEALEERERLGSTGFGRAIALPHARMENLNRPIAALMRLANPVEYNSADGLPVDLVIGLISPANAGAMHLHALAEISRLVRDEATHDALAGAQDEEQLYALLTNASSRDAA